MAIALSKQETESVLPSVKKFFLEELEVELSDMRAKQLLDYILREIGPLAYNQGVKDAEAFFRQRLEDLSATCFEEPLTYWSKQKKK